MILVDTSIWVDHLRKGNAVLSSLLEEGLVVCHPFIIGELACGNLKDRVEILGLLENLPCAPSASHEEALHVIHEHKLSGKGLGWADVHLLASALLANDSLWTQDKSLKAVATKLKLAPHGL